MALTYRFHTSYSCFSEQSLNEPPEPLCLVMVIAPFVGRDRELGLHHGGHYQQQQEWRQHVSMRFRITFRFLGESLISRFPKCAVLLVSWNLTTRICGALSRNLHIGFSAPNRRLSRLSGICASTFLPCSFMTCASFWNARLISPSTYQLISDALEAQSRTLSPSQMPRP